MRLASPAERPCWMSQLAPGTVARLAATRAGPSGQVTACDLSRAMLAVATAKPDLDGAAPITYLECPAEALDVSDGAFDVVVPDGASLTASTRPRARTYWRAVPGPKSGGRSVSARRVMCVEMARHRPLSIASTSADRQFGGVAAFAGAPSVRGCELSLSRTSRAQLCAARTVTRSDAEGRWVTTADNEPPAPLWFVVGGRGNRDAFDGLRFIEAVVHDPLGVRAMVGTPRRRCGRWHAAVPDLLHENHLIVAAGSKAGADLRSRVRASPVAASEVPAVTKHSSITPEFVGAAGPESLRRGAK